MGQNCGPLRLPLVPPSASEFQQINAIMHKINML